MHLIVLPLALAAAHLPVVGGDSVGVHHHHHPVHFRQHYPRLTYSTSYCDTGIMRDGSYTRIGSVANNHLRLGTRITTNIPFRGRRRFTVRDTGAPWAMGDGHLDFWSPSCADSRWWGIRRIRYRIGW